MSFVATLRKATAADHDAVDAGFGVFRLDDATDYGLFLVAHAQALHVVETALAGDSTLPAWRPRAALLAADLAALGLAMPASAPAPAIARLDDPDGRWGALYVIEGSRLGGRVLAKTVPSALPTAYLAAVHEQGEWRTLLAAIDARGAASDDRARAAIIRGARQTFALFAAAALAAHADRHR
ncbi:biliverdin-producing heme oxygenase [uncultured Sphingomonas sp.]|uniref:biliverdin-producing heme oxygenase n=1 Tax=uncultured Sphingomonas sp. TaxID=158754 RepID=UPI002599BF75|nr:biliverdin-producing heme oxygenase [uncultured Sphingomonas sp.]